MVQTAVRGSKVGGLVLQRQKRPGEDGELEHWDSSCSAKVNLTFFSLSLAKWCVPLLETFEVSSLELDRQL